MIFYFLVADEEEEKLKAPSSTEGTILQKKLTEIAAYIGYFGLVIGVLTSVVLFVRYFVRTYSIEKLPFDAGRDLNRVVEIISIGTNCNYLNVIMICKARIHSLIGPPPFAISLAD